MKLAIATPVLGHPSYASVSCAYMNSLLKFYRRSEVEVFERLCGNFDLVRARSRAVRMMLEKDFTHLLFWDSDVGGPGAHEALAGMLNEDKPIIGASYPRKLYRPGFQTVPAQSASHLGMGFTLIKRECLEDMCLRYRSELEFDDVIDGVKYPTVALFQLMLRDRALMGEDFSFCQRWIDMGHEVWLYDGPGAPLEHVGGHVYRQGTVIE